MGRKVSVTWRMKGEGRQASEGSTVEKSLGGCGASAVSGLKKGREDPGLRRDAQVAGTVGVQGRSREERVRRKVSSGAREEAQ